MATISIEGMDFYAYHGCFKEERVIGTKFKVDLWMDVDTKAAEDSDSLEDTINYLAVYQVVKREMEVSSKLLEHIGRRILNAVVKEFPGVKDAKVKVHKLNPPLGGKMDAVCLTIDL
ncbi:MAG: dihydroneopterin aldolase [Bacteroidales bacterium]